MKRDVLNKVRFLRTDTTQYSAITLWHFLNEVVELVNTPEELDNAILNKVGSYEVPDSDTAFKIFERYDPKFEKASQLADELGYRVKDINATLLATLLMRWRMRRLWKDLRRQYLKF